MKQYYRHTVQHYCPNEQQYNTLLSTILPLGSGASGVFLTGLTFTASGWGFILATSGSGATGFSGGTLGSGGTIFGSAVVALGW